MARPLYSNLANAILHLGTGGNAGLWYDKLCDRWSDDWTLSGDDDKKLKWIETVTEEPVGLEPLLSESTARVLRLTLAKSGVFGVFVTESRFVTGLGRSHPVENGFAWHPTLGVPYLPGSSVKGLVRAWAERDAEPRPTRKHVEEVLGSPGVAGHVVFVDAIPVARVQLEADVMTPHYAGWGPNDPPGDWCGPVPIPFLVVAPQTAFAFSLLPARASGTNVLPEVFAWLRSALGDSGAGAKTAVGYGRFRYDESRTEEWREKQDREHRAHSDSVRRAEAQRTPEGRWSLELKGKSEGQILEMVRLHLAKQPILDPTERRGFARAVEATGLPALWKRGDKRERETQLGFAKLKERAKLVHIAMEDPSSIL